MVWQKTKFQQLIKITGDIIFLPWQWPFAVFQSFSLAFHVRNYCTASLQWPYILLSPLVTIWFTLEYILQAMLPICQAIPLTVDVYNFCLNELKCGDSVCNVWVLKIPIYFTCTSSCEGNLNESSLFSFLLSCILSRGWAVPRFAHSWKYVLQHPGASSLTINLLGERYKTTVLLISPFKGTLFSVYSKKKLGQWV